LSRTIWSRQKQSDAAIAGVAETRDGQAVSLREPGSEPEQVFHSDCPGFYPGFYPSIDIQDLNRQAERHMDFPE
jgi:hypothetical protein